MGRGDKRRKVDTYEASNCNTPPSSHESHSLITCMMRCVSCVNAQAMRCVMTFTLNFVSAGRA